MSDTLEIIVALPPLHPGEVLQKEFLSRPERRQGCQGLRRTPNAHRAYRRRELGITGDTAVRLGRVLGTGPEFWMNLQSRFEIETAKTALAGSLEDLSELNHAA